jgi:hypothetical protein
MPPLPLSVIELSENVEGFSILFSFFAKITEPHRYLGYMLKYRQAEPHS